MRFQTLSHPSKIVRFDSALVNSVNSASRLEARIAWNTRRRLPSNKKSPT
jgi:hypothetical protein